MPKKMLIILFLGLLTLLCYTAMAVGKEAKPLVPSIHFICSGDRGNEQIYLRESERSRALFNIPAIGPYRNVDQKGHWIYKFDLRGAKRAEADLKVGNSYLIHLSSDGEHWQKMLDTEKTVRGLANLGIQTLDPTPFMADGFAYIKFEDTVKTDGWGPCLFEVTVRSDLGDGSIPKPAEENMPHFAVDGLQLQAGENSITGQIENPTDEKAEVFLHFESRSKGKMEYSEVQGINIQAKSHAPFEVKYSVVEAGEKLVILSLYRSSALLQRKSRISEMPEESFILMSTVSKQPYYSAEENAEIYVKVKASPEARGRLRIESALRKGGKKLESLTLKLDEEGEAEILYPIKALDPDNYAVDVMLLSNDGKKIDETSHEVTILPESGKTSVARIDEDGVLRIDGKRRFPLSLFLANPDEKIASAGFDGVVFGVEGAAYDTDRMDSLLRNLDTAEKLGIKVIPHICNFFRGKEDYEALREVVSRIKDSPALLCWYSADEPTATGTLPETLEKAQEIIHEIDPNHPVLVLSNDPGSFKDYVNGCDVFIADPYPIPDHPIDMVSKWTDMCRNATGDRIPVWMCLQAQGPPYYSRFPNPVEIRNMAYQAIIHGARGLFWWAYGPVKDSGHWEVYVKLVEEIRALEPALVDGKRGELRVIELDGGEIHTLTKHHGKSTYILAASVSETALECSFKTDQSVEVMFEERALKTEGGEFKDQFQPYGVHVYRIGDM